MAVLVEPFREVGYPIFLEAEHGDNHRLESFQKDTGDFCFPESTLVHPGGHTAADTLSLGSIGIEHYFCRGMYVQLD